MILIITKEILKSFSFVNNIKAKENKKNLSNLLFLAKY